MAESQLRPASLVILSAGGDLTWRKLIPALYDLYLDHNLPERCASVGMDRKDMNPEEFRQHLQQGVTQFSRQGQPDALLQIETPSVPAWWRYNGDGYGEHEDGLPFDGTGIGRAWPLLAGERAHYELAAGNYERSRLLLRTLESFANAGGMLPEQIWDVPDIPTRELFFGKPSGSAMPLVWAHTEYLKLVRSLQDKRVFDTQLQTQERYIHQKIESSHAIWRVNNKCLSIPMGKKLRVEVLESAAIRWTINSWETSEETHTKDTDLGLFYADLDTDHLTVDTSVVFTFLPPAPETLEGQSFTIRVRPADEI